MIRLIKQAAARGEHWVLGFMLLLLHISLWWGFGSAGSASLMLAHLGLFLLWQPIWRQDQRLDLVAVTIIALFTAGYVYWLSWWLIFIWLILLIGLVSGRTLIARQERYAYLLTLSFLVSELLIKCVPELFSVGDLPAEIIVLFKYGPLFVWLVIALIPLQDQVRDVDVFRAMSVSLLVAIIAIGSLLNMYHTAVEYPNALAQSLLALAAFLFVISWLLSPHAGFSGLAQLWERSLLNIGTPFETWLTGLATLAEQRQTPAEFLEAAIQELLNLPWIAAVRWSTPDAEGILGEPGAHEVELVVAELRVAVYTRRALGPTLLLHCKLLLQLLGHFYITKVREQELAQHAHLQAIFETGARVTHDIKNLLQSLQTITTALALEKNGAGSRRAGRSARKLLENQLPHITQRLQLALDKLQAPEAGATEYKPAREWWQSFLSRNAAPDISFEARLDADPPVPTELFDSVVENLLENTRNKRTAGTELAVEVCFETSDEAVRLTVTDSGPAVPEDKAAQLFLQRVDSDFGLGIGLYQAHRHAQIYGYELRLAANEPGRVTFELVREPPDQADQPQYSLFTAEARSR